MSDRTPPADPTGPTRDRPKGPTGSTDTGMAHWPAKGASSDAAPQKEAQEKQRTPHTLPEKSEPGMADWPTDANDDDAGKGREAHEASDTSSKT